MPYLRLPLRRGGARANRAARGSGHVRGGRERAALGRPARVRRHDPLPRASRRRDGSDGARGCDGRGSRRDRRAPLRARDDGVRVRGRLDGVGRRREVRAGSRSRARGLDAADIGRLVRRGAHAGERARPDADGEDDLCRRRAERGRNPVHLGALPPEHRRGDGVVRGTRRRDHRRAGRAHVVRGPAGRAADDARAASRRLRPLRVELPLRPRRHDRPAARAARHARADAPAVRRRRVRVPRRRNRRRRSRRAGSHASCVAFAGARTGRSSTNGGSS